MMMRQQPQTDHAVLLYILSYVLLFGFTFLKKFILFYIFIYFKLIFFVFLDHFDVLMSKIIFQK